MTAPASPRASLAGGHTVRSPSVTTMTQAAPSSTGPSHTTSWGSAMPTFSLTQVGQPGLLPSWTHPGRAAWATALMDSLTRRASRYLLIHPCRRSWLRGVCRGVGRRAAGRGGTLRASCCLPWRVVVAGIPCVFWDHVMNGGELAQQVVSLMKLRERTGLNARSKLEILCAEHDMYVAKINDRCVRGG